MINFELYKKNKKYLIFTLILIIISIINNVIINYVGLYVSELNNRDVNIEKLVINEIMLSNNGAYIDKNGNSYDWIELYNGYSKDINLLNYGLSDETDGSVKWLFPDVTIKSKEYMIIYLSGNEKKGLYANFSLNKNGGETITLKNATGKVVDSIKTLKIEKNTSLSRDNVGTWIVTDEITPGYQNNNTGRIEFLQNLINDKINSPLVLNEFLPANEGNVMFNDNNLYGYIEVINQGDNIINLSDYFLSNDGYTIYKWRLPKIKLNPGEVYIIYTNKLNKDNNASFDLKSKTGTIILSTYEGIVENISYENLSKGLAYVKENGNWKQTASISPGYTNDINGIKLFREKYDISKNVLVINEVMSSNNSYLAQNGNQFYDWIEIYNNSDKTINLSDYYLSTDSNDKRMYNLPNVNLKPNCYYLIMASGDEKLSNNLYYHANFKLSSGDGLFLFEKDELVDSLYIYEIPNSYSYGRGKTSGHYYFNNPTPGMVNNNGVIDIVDESMFNISGGIYNNVPNLSISLQGSDEIYYTLDGSIPNRNSKKYMEPIKVTKTTVIRAVSYENDKQNSEVITNTYIINENHKIPVVSISMPEQKFNLIQANTYGKNSTPAHAELYEEDSQFSVDCDFKLFGGESRNLSKKSFALKFNNKHLNYKVFDNFNNKNIYEFKTLVLRSGSQDQTRSMMRDEFFSSIAIKYANLDAQANKPVVLYINGKYWGVYYLREKIEDYFIENNYNVKGITNISSSTFVAEEGTNKDIINLRNYVRNHNLKIKENYDYVNKLLDIENYTDFWIYQFIIQNTDLHNIRYYNNPNVFNNKVRMILYDLDYGLYINRGDTYIDFMKNPTGMPIYVDNIILSSLLENEKYKENFIKRIGFFIKNIWTEANINNEFDLIYYSIEPEMKRNCERWNFSCEEWKKNTNKLRNNALKRREEVINITKKYFNLSKEQVNEYFY